MEKYKCKQQMIRNITLESMVITKTVSWAGARSNYGRTVPGISENFMFQPFLYNSLWFPLVAVKH